MQTPNTEAAPPQPPSKGKVIVKQLISLAIAAVFLYFAFRGCDWNKIVDVARNLDPLWVGLLCLAGVVSHLARAARWVILLAPLSDHKISLWNSFCAIMYGYAVNIVLPRGGEVARLVAISKSEKIPWAGVLPTMFIDRLLDVAMLVGLLGVSMTLLPLDKLDMPLLVPTGIAMCVATVVGLAALPFVGKLAHFVLEHPAITKAVPEKISHKVLELAKQFELGTKSMTNPAQIPIIIGLSVFIWFLYWLELYLMVFACHLEKQVSVVQSLLVFTVGSVGVLVPTPGSVGSYHFLVSKSLQQFAGIEANESLAFVTIHHFLTFIVISVIPAAVCMIVQSARNKRG